MPFTLSILPETIPVPLDDADMPGVVAHVRPLDAEQLATWFDAFPPGSHQEHLGIIRIIKQQLAEVDGIEVHLNGSAPVPFDVTQVLHLREFLRNRKAINALFAALMARANLSDDTAKKSSSPAASPGAQSGGISSAASVATSGEMSTTAGSPPPSDQPIPSTSP